MRDVVTAIAVLGSLLFGFMVAVVVASLYGINPEPNGAGALFCGWLVGIGNGLLLYGIATWYEAKP